MEDPKTRFIELFQATGWSIPQAAKKLQMTRGGVHSLVRGDKNPSMATVKLMELVMQSEGIRFVPESLLADALRDRPNEASKSSWVDELLMNLNALSDSERQSVVNCFLDISRIIKNRKR